MTRPKLNDEFLYCRIRGHDWDPIPDDGGLRRTYRESRSVSRVSSRCSRCGSVKLEIWSKITGEIITKPEIRYPDGYKYTIDDRPSRNEFRKEILKRDLLKPKRGAKVVPIKQKRSA